MDTHVDPRVRELVDVLNQIPGVTTRASCEGAGHSPVTHRHSDAAYVAFRHPLPLRFQAFLLAEVGALARLEDDGVYSRWPARNTAFIDSTLAAARSYLGQPVAARRGRVCWTLPKFRARLARQLSSGEDFCVQLCRQCGDLVFDQHPAGHHPLPLLRCAPDQAAQWFALFLQQPRNRLDPALIAADGWASLIARTQRAEFGVSFQRRWLRYRARMLAELATRQIRAGAERVRRLRPELEIDFFYTDTHVVLEWAPSG